MNHEKGCFVCGKDLVYKSNVEDLICVYCQKLFQGDVACTEGHYICDLCHAASANAIIETYSVNSHEINPTPLSGPCCSAGSLL